MSGDFTAHVIDLNGLKKMLVREKVGGWELGNTTLPQAYIALG
jgi:hypothetical protein